MRGAVLKGIGKVRKLDRARAAVEERGLLRPRSIQDLPLMRWVPYASPGLAEPQHLEPIVTDLDLAFQPGGRAGIRKAYHAPVRHWKTITAEHAIALGFARDPTLRVMYGAYNEKRANAVSDEVRTICQQVGIPLRADKKGVTFWRTPQGGFFLPVGVGGTATGFGFNVGLLDDLYKDRLEAESANRRNKVDDWVRGTFFNRAEPGASIMLLMARWHSDDQTARLIEEGWEYVCLPAIREEVGPDGEVREVALCPSYWPLEELYIKRKDEGEYNWVSLYQGEPRPAEGLLFHNARYLRSAPPPRPDVRIRYAIGVDFTWKSSQTSDYSALVVMARVDIRYPEKRTYYVIVDAYELQRRATAVRHETTGEILTEGFCSFIRQKMQKWSTNRVATHAGNAEQGLIRTVRDGHPDERVPIVAFPAKAKKWIRAQKYAAEWNAGQVSVIEGRSWTRSLVLEHVSFTGEENAKDNFVDAAVSAYTALNTGHGGAA